jgi:hypothetical protein
MLKKMLFLGLLLPGLGGCIWPRERGPLYDETRWGYEEGGDWHAESRVGAEMREGGHEERGSGHEERGGGGEHSGGHR